MFERITLHGGPAAILWGYRTAVSLTHWRITRHDGHWTLTGTIGQIDRFQARQKPLLFTAPREGAHDGFWAWGVNSLDIGTHSLRATLGPPEQ